MSSRVDSLVLEQQMPHDCLISSPTQATQVPHPLVLCVIHYLEFTEKLRDLSPRTGPAPTPADPCCLSTVLNVMSDQGCGKNCQNTPGSNSTSPLPFSSLRISTYRPTRQVFLPLHSRRMNNYFSIMGCFLRQNDEEMRKLPRIAVSV